MNDRLLRQMRPATILCLTAPLAAVALTIWIGDYSRRKAKDIRDEWNRQYSAQITQEAEAGRHAQRRKQAEADAFRLEGGARYETQNAKQHTGPRRKA